MPFKSLSAVSYSPSIVTMTVSAAIMEIFTVKEWPDLEIWVWGPSRSLKTVRFDRPCMTEHSCAETTSRLRRRHVRERNKEGISSQPTMRSGGASNAPPGGVENGFGEFWVWKNVCGDINKFSVFDTFVTHRNCKYLSCFHTALVQWLFGPVGVQCNRPID